MMAPDTPDGFTAAISATGTAAGPNTFRRVGRSRLPARSTARCPSRPRISSVPSAGDSRGGGRCPSSSVARRTGAAGSPRGSALDVMSPAGSGGAPALRGSSKLAGVGVVGTRTGTRLASSQAPAAGWLRGRWRPTNRARTATTSWCADRRRSRIGAGRNRISSSWPPGGGSARALPCVAAQHTLRRNRSTLRPARAVTSFYLGRRRPIPPRP